MRAPGNACADIVHVYLSRFIQFNNYLHWWIQKASALKVVTGSSAMNFSFIFADGLMPSIHKTKRGSTTILALTSNLSQCQRWAWAQATYICSRMAQARRLPRASWFVRLQRHELLLLSNHAPPQLIDWLRFCLLRLPVTSHGGEMWRQVGRRDWIGAVMGASQVSSSLPMSETTTAIGEMQGPHHGRLDEEGGCIWRRRRLWRFREVDGLEKKQR
jgi:hypothetical protein